MLQAQSIPSTPSTVCDSTCSTATPVTSSSSGFASSVWSHSPRSKARQIRPASSTSSTATELDEGSTQLEPKADDQVDASVSITVEDGGKHVEKRGWGGSTSSCTAGAPWNSHSQSCGAKRPREQTADAPQLHHLQRDDSSPRPSPVGDKQTPDEQSPQALPSDLVNSRWKRGCLERSQYPRLDGHRTPGAGPRSHRPQLNNLGMEEESVPCVPVDAPRHMFNSGMGSPATFCGKRRGHGSYYRAEMEVAGNGSAGPEHASAENLPAQDSMNSLHPTDQSDGDKMDFDGAEHEPLASDASHDAASSEQGSPDKIPRSESRLPAATCGNSGGQFDEQPADNMAVADAMEEEASALRDAGVTGDEEFKELFAKLKRLKWRWGGAVTSLGNERWICKAGVNSKTATVGVDKFAREEEVMNYVRGVLGRADATLDNEDGPSGEERYQGTEGLSEDDYGDRDMREHDKGQGEVEKIPATQDQRGPFGSTPKGRALQAALEALNPSNAPGVLQQRTTEFNQVLRFVTTSVAKASGGSLYLCGVPGTGKTQTMAHVQAEVHKIYAKVSKGDDDKQESEGCLILSTVGRPCAILLSPPSDQVRIGIAQRGVLYNCLYLQ